MNPVVMFVFGVVCIEVYHTEMPVWAFILALLIAFIYIIPIGIIQAITNQQVGLNVITELIVGYALPGRPIAMMMFKTWGYITMAQALTFTSDFKLGHYMKVPPRPMFWCQVVATALAGTVQLGVQSWVFSNIDDICSPHQRDGFSCPNTTVFGTASIIWGVIGPARQFSAGQIFNKLLWFFLIGAFVPVITYLIQKRFPGSFLKYVNWPVIFTGTGLIPPATPTNYISWCLVGFIFNYVIRRRAFSWWTKYNCAFFLLSFSFLCNLKLTQRLWNRRAVRRPRLWPRHRDDRHLLLPQLPQERHHRRQLHPDLVGQHRLCQHRRLERAPALAVARERHFRVRTPSLLSLLTNVFADDDVFQSGDVVNSFK